MTERMINIPLNDNLVFYLIRLRPKEKLCFHQSALFCISKLFSVRYNTFNGCPYKTTEKLLYVTDTWQEYKY